MTSDSKIFVGLRSTKKKPASPTKTLGHKCQWDNCENEGVNRAPVGRDAEGLYLLFCPKHTKEYNSGYNFAVELSDPEVARYQKEAATGRRRTWGTPIN